MNTLSLLLLAFIVIANVVADDRQQAWEDFKQGKDYENEEEENQRLEAFLDNLDRIERHNSDGKSTFKLAVNQFADLSHSEFCDRILPHKRSIEDVRSRHGNHEAFAPRGTDLPESVDWRDEGAVTPVKDQGACGSCWSFSSTGALEAQHYLATGDLVSLSEQNLVDCTNGGGNFGCDGGWMDVAFDYIRDNDGINCEESYPYEAQDGECRFDADNVAATVTGYITIPEGDENALAEAVATVGPVSVLINANDNLQSYGEGVYNDDDCNPDELDHAVLIVGYGSDPEGGDYWIVKNSWSEAWGEGGYVRMARNVNMCGIANAALYPTV